MKKELKLGKRLLSLALTLAVALTFTVTAPEAAFATTTSTLSIGGQASGTLTGGYTTNVTPQTSSDGTLYKMYTISIKADSTSDGITGDRIVGTANPKGGTFGAVTTSGNTSTVTYTVSSSATPADVTYDLSAITYKGAGKVTIKAGGTPTLEKGSNENGHYDDVEYNGHIYRLWKTTKKWGPAMIASIEAANATYTGYKGHPLTITSGEENSFVRSLWNTAKGNTDGNSTQIWLAAVSAAGTKDNTEGGYESYLGIYDYKSLPTVSYKSNEKNGSGNGWIWLPETPEGKGNTKNSDRLPSNTTGATYWASDEPDGEYSENGLTYVVVVARDGWSDLTEAMAEDATCYYITEYTPYYNGGWQSATQAEERSQSFSNSNVKAVGIDYEAETFTGLLEGTNYTVTGAGTLTASAEGTLALKSTSGTVYNLIGTTDTDITVTREGSAAAQTIKVPARKVVSLTEDDVTKYSTKLVVAVTKTVAKDGYEYNYKFEEGDWATDTDNDAKIVYSGLTSGATYTITAQVMASNVNKVFKSEPKSIDVTTLPKYGQSENSKNGGSAATDSSKTDTKTDADKTDDKTDTKTDIDTTDSTATKAEIAAVKAVNSKTLKATSKKIKKNGKTAVKISWKAPSGVKLDGYQIYRSTKKSTLGKKLYDKTTKTTYTNAKNLKKGKTYYYKVRGYKTVDGKKVYTGWSTIAHRTIK